MHYRKLGNSGLLVSELALGAMIFGEQGDRGAAPDEARRIIRRYLAAGGNHFDLANVYAAGASAAELHLTPDEITALDEASAVPAVYPYRSINSTAR